ncbi:FAD-dependent oxidoreductase [Bosea sp. Root483D1]|uniref:NAD(P)/FAD-dependent oxidoreductase n=1 Tax=Bosea sp. Root483D1 TaxID=1736544 RepID=UPI000709B232|nr:FAD-dependent oxidoreductase [Bosea sp. Root483D1]KRE14511.1 FAD-dependent oxidoreductase [Bosea sp. Root483D1]
MTGSGYDLVVVGGGLIGAAIAWGASRAGASVALLDEGDVAHRASRGNFGLIWLQGKGVGKPAYMHWSLRAGRLWKNLAEELGAATGLDIGWRPAGGLHFCFSEAELEKRRDILARTHADGGEISMQFLDRTALRDLVPGIGPDVAGASFSPEDSHVSPLYLLRALQRALQDGGGSYRPGTTVTDIRPEASGFAVATPAGPVRGRRIVLAAGLGSARLAPQLGLSMPVEPERGQIVVTERVRPCFPYAANCLRQTAEGSFLFGSSHEEVGFDEGTQVATAADLCATALRVLPGLDSAGVVRFWGSLRVMTPDGLPIYEESSRYPGAFAATCHSGVTLASVHAFDIGPAVAAGTLPAAVASFGSGRFDVQAD